MSDGVVPAGGLHGEERAEVLYESKTTRVSRQMRGQRSVIVKQALGTDSHARQRHESGLLQSLAGIDGVVRLAGGKHPPGVITLEDCGAISLCDVLREGPLEIGLVLDLATKLLRTLVGVHRAGVIHRDINPANILVATNGMPVLIDFDLAFMAGHLPPGAEGAGEIVGTPGYLAPEQTGRTGHAVDHRADLYAVGVTLYEMVTGKLPFAAADLLALVHDHLVREPAFAANAGQRLPAMLPAIILRLLAKAPEDRYQSAEGMLHDLQVVRSAIERGDDADFELGQRDFPARFTPDGLVGREAELSVLQAVFAQALGSASRTVLIHGPAGVGKSALIHEFRPTALAANGWVVHGKVDQYQKERLEAGALTQALCALGRMLLAQPAEVLASERERIAAALGPGAGQIAALSPEFALILGPQGELAPMDPGHAELRQQQALVDLVAAVASPTRPLVMVLDDLQWAGAHSLRGVARLMNEPGLGGLILVGVFRDDGTGPCQAMSSLLATRQPHNAPPTHIALTNLGAMHSAELLARLLRLAPQRAQELAQAIGVLTDGNPFDTIELVNALRSEGVLSLGEAGWQWDALAIRHFVGRGDVADLLAARLARLAPASRDLLSVMGCLGHFVPYALLAAASGCGGAEVREHLRVPLEDGLLVAGPDGGPDGIGFRHDRVQQAVHAATGEEERALRQLAMARRLAAQPHFEAQAARQYLAVLGQGLALHDAAEMRRAAGLLQGAARELSRIASYEFAERYLDAANALLASMADDDADSDLRLQIDYQRHEALYCLGRHAEADAVFEALRARVVEPVDLVDAASLQIRSLEARGNMRESSALGLDMLAKLGLHAPPAYAVPDADARLTAVAEWIALDAHTDYASRPQVRDRRVLAIAKLLVKLTRSAYSLVDMDMATWLLLESQRLWADHGPCPDMVANFGGFYGVYVRRRQDFRAGYAMCRHAIAVGQALGWEPQTAAARFVFGGFCCHWFEPLENALHQLELAFEGARGAGDPIIASQVHPLMMFCLMDLAPTLDVTQAETENGLALCRQTGNAVAAAMHTGSQRLVLALRGLTLAPASFDDAQFSEQDYMARMGHLPYVYKFIYQHAFNALILGDGATLAKFADTPLQPTAIGNYTVFHMHLFVALARAWQLQGKSAANEAQAAGQLGSSLQWLGARALEQPYNFLHLLRLVQAEQSWALGDFAAAALRFDEALGEAGLRPRAWHRALITERAGLFHLARGLNHAGRGLLMDARDQYSEWGAEAKVSEMQREHAFFAAPPRGGERAPRSSRGTGKSSGNISADTLDLLGVLRASQLLSSETSMHRLAARVSDVLAALSGATRVLVFSRQDGQWSLLTPYATQASVPLAEASEMGLLPVSVFSYVERIGELLRVDDAAMDDRFARDPYFAGTGHCSLLAVPIAGQGGLSAMLMLENRQGRGAFNAQRLDAVKLIAGQLVVSLANAQLYESLEDRVQARTRELTEAQARLVATARRAGMAEIANNVLHNVGNVLNSVNVSASLARRTLNGSRLEGLARAVAIINEHAADLGGFIRSDPRGGALVPYLNELVLALQSDRDCADQELERLISSVDHISYVVATQQSHAGPSSVLEPAKPQDLVEEALRISAEAIARHGVSVMRRYADIPTAELDRQRLLQILVNLICNAAQAMENVPPGSRRLSVDTLLKRGDAGDRLQIVVQDQGEGIAAQDMTRIFSHGFTTRRDGHGFGLHSSALAALEMGGWLSADSEGPGKGARFTLELPFGLRDPS